MLALEKRFITNNFSFRIFSTMLGIYFTNIFFAYRFLKDSRAVFLDVMREVAIGLIHNDHRAEEELDRRLRERQR